MAGREECAEAISRISRSISLLLSGMSVDSDLRLDDRRCDFARFVRLQLGQILSLARTAGLFSFATLALRLAEHLEPSLRAESVPPSEVLLLRDWAYASQGYLNSPGGREPAITLVDLIAAPSCGQIGPAERLYLLSCLLEDQLEFHSSTASRPKAPRH